ncbi:MAG: glycosyltransferase family 39 protein [Phycisphaerae bacterium]|nr:glycosyltransferase family 39 protein [Phycisphaerae bacterium]
MVLRHPTLCLLVILAVAAGLRLSHIRSNSLWSDEGYTAYLTARPITEYARELKGDTAPPLFFYIVRPMAKLFPRSEAALRFPSAVLGVLAVGLTYLLGRELTGKPIAGLVAAGLLATSRFQILRSQEARSYPLYLVAALGVMVCLARMGKPRAPELQKPGPLVLGLNAMLLIVACLATVYTHNVGWFFVAGLLIGFPLMRLGAGRSETIRAIVTATVVAAIVAVAYLPWAPVLRAQMGRVMADYWISRPTVGGTVGHLGRMVFDPSYPPEGFRGLLGPAYRARELGYLLQIAVWSAGGIGWAMSFSRRDRRCLGLLAGLTVGLAAMIVFSLLRQPIFMDKSATPFMVVPLLGVGLLADRVWAGGWPARLGRGVVYAILLLGLLVAIANHGTNIHEQWREATRWAVAKAAPAGEPILFDDPHNMMAAEWYLAGSTYEPIRWSSATPTLLLPGGSVMPAARDRPLAMLPPAPIVEALRRELKPGRRLWVIERYDELLRPELEKCIREVADEQPPTRFHAVRVRQFIVR